MDDRSVADEACVDLASVTASDFRGAMEDGFRLSHAAGHLDLRLIDVADRRAGQRSAGAFSLLFVSAPGPYVPQAIYRLTSRRLGTLEFFLVPIGPTDDGNGYEAVFA